LASAEITAVIGRPTRDIVVAGQQQRARRWITDDIYIRIAVVGGGNPVINDGSICACPDHDVARAVDHRRQRVADIANRKLARVRLAAVISRAAGDGVCSRCGDNCPHWRRTNDIDIGIAIIGRGDRVLEWYLVGAHPVSKNYTCRRAMKHRRCGVGPHKHQKAAAALIAAASVARHARHRRACR
jgi:hypothetical protein